MHCEASRRHRTEPTVSRTRTGNAAKHSIRARLTHLPAEPAQQSHQFVQKPGPIPLDHSAPSLPHPGSSPIDWPFEAGSQLCGSDRRERGALRG